MEIRIFLSCIALLAPLRGQQPQSAANVTGKTIATSAGGPALKARPVFVPLAPGAVTPEGWLRDWAVDAANGITGHLDEYSNTYGQAWKGGPVDGMRANPDGTGWPLEQSSYWLDGAVRLAYILDDKALIVKVSSRLDTVVNGVLNGGESFVFWRPNSVLKDTFNNWAHSHMGRALVAYYQATGDVRILKALIRTYSGYPLPEFRSPFYPVSGTVNIDPMLDTYLMSGEPSVLGRVQAFAAGAGYQRIRGEWLNGDLKPGHNVIFYENIRVPALLYPLTSGKDDLSATIKALAWAEERFLLPFGMISGEEYHAGIGATRNTETCNVAASMWTFLWLLRITGEAGYGDRIERVFLNGGPAPVARDFKTMSYYQSPNRYSSKLPEDEPQHPGDGCYRFTNIGHRVLCCVGNLNRVIPFYIQHLLMATLDGGLAATLYGPSQVRFRAAGVPVHVETRTAYPFEEIITLTVNPDQPVEFPLYVRVPAWCVKPGVKVNGNSVAASAGRASFVKIARQWRSGDKVVLRFPMSAGIVTGRETPYPRIDYFAKGRRLGRETAVSNPYASVYYGPLLFALPIRDQDPNSEAPNAVFNYALDLAPEKASTITVARHAMPAKWTWSLDSPIQLTVPARQFDWQPTETQPLPKEPVKEGRPAKMVLVPYGCTKFRVSMFPVTERSWAADH